MTFQDLVANSSGWKLITGGRTIWSQMLDMGANAGKPFQLHNLPYQEVSIIATTNQFPIVEQAYVMTNLAEAYFPKSQVLHDKYQNYDWDVNGAHLYGMSPLKSALRRLSRRRLTKRSWCRCWSPRCKKRLHGLKHWKRNDYASLF